MTSDLKKNRREFANRLIIALAELGYQSNEQNALGKLFGISGQAVKKWINGESTPSTSRMSEIAEILGVRRAWLFDGEGPMRDKSVTKIEEEDNSDNIEENQEFSISKEELELLCCYRRLPTNVRKTFKTIIEQFSRPSVKK